MRISMLISFSGIGLVVVAVILLGIFQVIISSNSPQYSTGKLVLEPDQSDVGPVKLEGDKAEIRLYLKEEGSLVQVTLVNQNGDKVGELVSDKKFDHVVLDNPYLGGEFSLVATNLGDSLVTLAADIRDYKEPGTFIDTPDAIFLLIPLFTGMFAAGLIVLFFSAGIGYVEWKKNSSRKFN